MHIASKEYIFVLYGITLILATSEVYVWCTFYATPALFKVVSVEWAVFLVNRLAAKRSRRQPGNAAPDMAYSAPS